MPFLNGEAIELLREGLDWSVEARGGVSGLKVRHAKIFAKSYLIPFFNPRRSLQFVLGPFLAAYARRTVDKTARQIFVRRRGLAGPRAALQ